jgi:hypothetical protein
MDGIHNTGELDQSAVAHKLDDVAMKLRYCRIDQLFATRHEPRECSNLILPHEAAVADHIGRKYPGKSSLHPKVSVPSRSKGVLASSSVQYGVQSS